MISHTSQVPGESACTAKIRALAEEAISTHPSILDAAEAGAGAVAPAASGHALLQSQLENISKVGDSGHTFATLEAKSRLESQHKFKSD